MHEKLLSEASELTTMLLACSSTASCIRLVS